jgi:hypothetical protein
LFVWILASSFFCLPFYFVLLAIIFILSILLSDATGDEDDASPWWVEGIEVILDRHAVHAGKMALVTKALPGSQRCSVLLYAKHREMDEPASHVCIGCEMILFLSFF